jgi:hypothetical protein
MFSTRGVELRYISAVSNVNLSLRRIPLFVGCPKNRDFTG